MEWVTWKFSNMDVFPDDAQHITKVWTKLSIIYQLNLLRLAYSWQMMPFLNPKLDFFLDSFKETVLFHRFLIILWTARIQKIGNQQGADRFLRLTCHLAYNFVLLFGLWWDIENCLKNWNCCSKATFSFSWFFDGSGFKIQKCCSGATLFNFKRNGRSFQKIKSSNKSLGFSL